MITVGFGDIVPKTIKEKLYVIVVQLISCGIFAYVVNSIGGIFSDIAKKTAEFKYFFFIIYKIMIIFIFNNNNKKKKVIKVRNYRLYAQKKYQ